MVIITLEFISKGSTYSAVIGTGIIIVNTKKLTITSVKAIFLLL